MRNGPMKLGIMPEGAGRTGSDWLDPAMPPYPGTDFEKHRRQALIGEEFKADFFFVADTLWADAGSPPHRLDREPAALHRRAQRFQREHEIERRKALHGNQQPASLAQRPQ